MSQVAVYVEHKGTFVIHVNGQYRDFVISSDAKGLGIDPVIPEYSACSTRRIKLFYDHLKHTFLVNIQ